MRDRVSFDTASFSSGIAIVALGGFALLESEGAVDLGFGWAAVVVTAVAGAIFLLSGLAGGEDRHG